MKISGASFDLDPENLPLDDVRRVRDEIRGHVEALLASLEEVPA